MLLAPPLARFALSFGPAEFASLLLLAMIVVAYIGSGETIKALMIGTLGLALGTIGTDQISGFPRFDLGIRDLQDGIGVVPVAIGVFGISEVLVNVEALERKDVVRTSLRGIFPSMQDYRDSALPILRGTLVGFLVGILPGGSHIVSSFLSYGIEKKVSRHPEKFGHGAIEGVAGPESANNAATSAAFVPLLSLGIPSNAVMALMLGALLIHGVIPGPKLISEQPTLFWGVIGSMYVGNAMLLALNLPLVGLWVQVLRVPYRILLPLIIIFCLVGVYCINGSHFEMFLTILFGVFGYVMRKLDYDIAPLIMGVIIGPMFETAFRQALLLSKGSFSIFVTRPISACLLGVVFVLLAKTAIFKAGKGLNIFKKHKD